MINSHRHLEICLWQSSVCREGRTFGADRVLVYLMVFLMPTPTVSHALAVEIHGDFTRAPRRVSAECASA